MNCVIRAVLYNPNHPEYGRMMVPFPLTGKERGSILEMMREIGIGDAIRQDCRVDSINSHYSVLQRMVRQMVNVDELDYLAKRLDSFCSGEDAQFQGMAEKLGLTDVKDFINLTFCCQQATVITDFSDLDRVGKDHCMVINGGCLSVERLQELEGETYARDLIQNHAGVITPYGVVYDNGMKLKELYQGREFPPYIYESTGVYLSIRPEDAPEDSDSITYLHLPESREQITRTLLRGGIDDPAYAQWEVDMDELPTEIGEKLDLERADLWELNEMCEAVCRLSDTEKTKLNAVIQFAAPSDVSAVKNLANNLERFEFIPNVNTLEEYGRYMIQESGHFNYDENLDGYYDFERYAQERLVGEPGGFTPYGHVRYMGDMPLVMLLSLPDEAPEYVIGGMQ